MSSRRHLSSLKSLTHGYDATLDPPSLLTDVTRDFSLPPREPSCSLLDVSLRPRSPIESRSPHLRRSLSMGVGAGVSRSAPHLATRPRQHPQPRVFVRCNTEANVAPPLRPRNRLQKSRSLGENDRRWEICQDADYFPEAWEFSNRARSKSLTREDFSLRPPARKTVTYEDEVLRKRLQKPPPFSRSSLSLDKSVPYESDFVVSEHTQDPYVRKSRAVPDGYTQVSQDQQQQKQQQQQQQAPDAARGLYRRCNSVRLTDGHSAGTYYGYDSDYSGAETEVFLPDRSLDRSFSLEQVDQRNSELEFIRDEQYPAEAPELSQHSSLTMQEGCSQTLPRARRPSTGPSRKVIMRANTESALFKGPSKGLREKVNWKPPRGEQERMHSILREPNLGETPSRDRRAPLEAVRGVHSSPALSRVLDGAIAQEKYESGSSDDVFIPIEQRRHCLVQPESDRDSRPVDAYDGRSAEGRRYHYTSLPHDQTRARDHEDTRLRHSDLGEDRRPLDSQVLEDGARFLEHDERDEGRYLEQGPRDEAMYREPDLRDEHRYRRHGSREEIRFREQDPRDEIRFLDHSSKEEVRCRDHGSREEVRYREHSSHDEARNLNPGHIGETRSREHNPREEARYREHASREDIRHRKHGHKVEARYMEHPRNEVRYRELGSREEVRYREHVSRDDPRYQEYLQREDIACQEPLPREEESYREREVVVETGYRDHNPRVEGRFQDLRDEERYREEQKDDGSYREPDTRMDSRYQDRDEGRYLEDLRDRDDRRYQDQDLRGGDREETRYREPPYPETSTGARPRRPERERSRDDIVKDERYRQRNVDQDRYRGEIPLEKERYKEQEDLRYRDAGAMERERYKEYGAIEKDRYKRWSSVTEEKYRERLEMGERDYRADTIEQDRFRSCVSLDQDRFRDQGHDPYRDGSEGPERGYKGQAEDRKHYGIRRDFRDRRLYDDHGGDSYEGEDLRFRDMHHPSYDPTFPFHDPRRPPDHRRDAASHPHHTSHPHDLAHAHLTNTPHAHSYAAHETRAADPSYNVAEPPPHHHPFDTDHLEGEIPDTDRPLTPRVRHSSSVSINEHPEYFEFDANSPPSTEPRADADVDPSSNPASEFSHRTTAFGPTGVSIGGASKRGQLGRSLSTSEVPETEKAGMLTRLACPTPLPSPTTPTSPH